MESILSLNHLNQIHFYVDDNNNIIIFTTLINNSTNNNNKQFNIKIVCTIEKAHDDTIKCLNIIDKDEKGKISFISAGFDKTIKLWKIDDNEQKSITCL